MSRGGLELEAHSVLEDWVLLEATTYTDDEELMLSFLILTLLYYLTLLGTFWHVFYLFPCLLWH